MERKMESQMVEIGATSLPVIEYRGTRVITLAMVDLAHQRPAGTASRNFKSNRNRFVEGEDFHRIDFAQKDEFRPMALEIPPRGMILLSETGYLMLVKSFTDDLAWQVQRALVNRYFQLPPPKSKAHELLRSVQLLVEHEERVQRLESAQLEQQRVLDQIAQRQDDMDGDTGYMTALAFCRREGIPAPLSFAKRLGSKASDMCRKLSIRMGQVPDERWGSVNSYPVEILRECRQSMLGG
ncbi:ORF6N domain-containing protein [Magnetofaba australis]|uniref:KilA-N DNA-binding domain-containing protein n=1 Tax=Magnetofaba australis IT-1 TaxID=1434232 RepID=A0A1Y2K562_9PROT|nr:ORF6N domain-containing protein [Magnetofaba australis]OSM04465.1 hypothetical protein MAIT1_04379 [Magnetofaba australis IT-1]